jgi:hypothetical protein
MKTCRKCLTQKTLGDFYSWPVKHRQVIDTYCKRCANAKRASNRAVKYGVKRRKRDAAKAAAVARPDKVCRGCEQTLPKESFYKQRDMLDGHLLYCKACHDERRRVTEFLKRKAKARTKGLTPDGTDTLHQT